MTRPRTPFMPPSPNRGAAPSTTWPRSPNRSADAVVLPHHGAGQAAAGRDLSLGPHREALVGSVDHAGAAEPGGAAGGLRGLREADAVAPEPCGIELNLELAHFPAEDRHLGHARRREQPGTQHPIDEGALLHRASAWWR